jgi:hypothetical protein
MFMGRKTTYTPKANEHTMIINIDRQAGAFTCLVWDGFMSPYASPKMEKPIGTFAKGSKRIEVYVYGGALPKTRIVELLTAFVGGKWRTMTLNEVAGGAMRDKHTL